MNGFFRHSGHQRSWGNIVFDFFSTIKDNFNNAVREQQMKLVRRIASAILLSIGAVFFLVGFSIFLGMLINKATWSGLMVVGIVIALIGLLMPKR